uniref:Chromo domain-containing protein n=1 Tax=Anopheles epiroticus TaxID=199890 RepID=A0A182PLZ9_9DIPT
MDPSDIGKYPDLIKKAQADISCCDVLVCGRCHAVFHLIELFREHKENEPDCKRSPNSTLHNCDEAQGKVWAFLLWKSAQRQAAGEEKNNPGQNNSWKLYQSWVKLEESVRDTWIVAGKTIQSFSKTGAGSLQEMPVKITKTILEPQGEAPEKKPVAGTGGPVPNRFTPTTVRKLSDPKAASTPAAAGGTAALETKNRIVVGAQVPAKKPDGTVMKMGTVATTPGTPTRRSYATRTHPKLGSYSEEEVEKILAKRFSPIVKMHEYLVKWARMQNDQNTWEPLTHLHSCQSILEHFEVQLAKQKEQRAAAAARALQLQRQEKGGAVKSPGSAGSSTAGGATTGGGNAASASATTTTGGSTGTSINTQLRPIRTSKASAIDRVKMWTAGESGDDAANGKRKLDDGETDDAADGGSDAGVKKVKTEPSTATETVTKVSQGGSVKIISGTGASGIVKTAVNGGTVSVGQPGKEGNAAEVVIIKSPKDGVMSGISKKVVTTGSGGSGVGGNSITVAGTRLSPRTDASAKVKIVSKSEVGGGGHGIFKVKTEPTGSSPQSSPKATGVTAASTTTTYPASRPITIAATTATTDSSGVTTRFIRRNVDGTEQLVKQTIRKTPKLVPFSPAAGQARPVGTVVGVSKTSSGTPVPKVTTSAAIGSQQRIGASPRVGIQQKPPTAVSRVVSSSTGTPGNVVRTSTVTRTVSGATPSSEQKINALRRQGVNVVKRVITTSTVAGGSSNKKPAEEEENGESEGLSMAQPAPPSPPPAMTLCPVTGKVLSQAEGEPTPVPSPEADPEPEKKLTPKADSGVGSSTETGADGGSAIASGEQQMVVAGGDQTDTQVQQLLTNEDGSPIIVAGEDGTLYQVAGKNAEGQTILIAQGADGEQSCVLVASQEGEEEGAAAAGGTGGVLTLDAAVSEAVAVPQEGQEMTEEQVAQYQQSVDTNQELTISTEDSQDNQITAEVVQADQPSPGGTRRVVLLLPDGNLMVTEVNDETYQTLNLVN